MSSVIALAAGLVAVWPLGSMLRSLHRDTMVARNEAEVVRVAGGVAPELLAITDRPHAQIVAAREGWSGTPIGLRHPVCLCDVCVAVADVPTATVTLTARHEVASHLDGTSVADTLAAIRRRDDARMLWAQDTFSALIRTAFNSETAVAA